MSDPFQCEALPPERRRRRSMILASGSCSCCCCCCLHTIGGLIGAARGPSPSLASTAMAGRLYWLMVAMLTVLSFMYVIGIGAGLVAVALSLAIFFPLVQLVASVLTAGLVMLSPAQDKRACLKRVGQISLRSFGYALIGVVLMASVGVVLS